MSTLCDLIDELVKVGVSEVISLSPAQYRTFCRERLGIIVLRPAYVVYRGVRIVQWECDAG